MRFDDHDHSERDREHAPRRASGLAPHLAVLLAAPFAALGTAAAQPEAAPPPQPAERAPEPPQAEPFPAAPLADPPPADAPADDGDQAVSDLERARRELAEARRKLEDAAREVARLSERSLGPAVLELRRQWAGAGQRALLGIVVMDSEDGALVSAVSPGGPADEAGVRTGDVIVAIDGAPVIVEGETPSRVVIRRLSEIDPGDDVELRLRSGGGTRIVRVTTRERDDRITASEGPFFRLDRWTRMLRSSDRWASMELAPLTPDLGAYFGTERGLLVVRAPDAEPKVLREGDVILEIGGREPRSPEHAMSILATYEPGETLTLTIMREQRRQTLEIDVPQDDVARARGRGVERRDRPPRGWTERWTER